MTVKIVGVAIAILAFGILMELPKKYLCTYAVLGAISGGAYLVSLQVGADVTLSCYISALAVTIVSNISSRVLKVPVLVFLVGGILPTVPGSSLYLSVYHMMAENTELAVNYFVETLMISGVISLGIFFGDALFKGVYRKRISKVN